MHIKYKDRYNGAVTYLPLEQAQIKQSFIIPPEKYSYYIQKLDKLATERLKELNTSKEVCTLFNASAKNIYEAQLVDLSAEDLMREIDKTRRVDKIVCDITQYTGPEIYEKHGIVNAPQTSLLDKVLNFTR